MSSTYEALATIAEEEMPGIGSYALDKQMRDLGINLARIGMDDIPSIARAMSEVAAMFGRERAKSLRRRMLAIMPKEEGDFQGRSPEKRIAMLSDIGYSAYFSGEWDEAVENLEKARELALKHDFRRKVIEIDAKMARILSRKKDFEHARSLLKEAERFLKQTHDRDLKAEVLYEWGAVEWWSGNEDAALEHFRKSLDMAKRLGDLRLMGLAHMGMANVYSEIGDVEKDLEHSLEALNQFEKADAKEEMAKMYTNIGVTYEDLGNLREAENYYLLCVQYSRSIGYLLTEAWAYLNLSELYVKLGEYSSAEAYASSALEAYREMKDGVGMSIARERFAMIYAAKKDYERAEKEFEETISLKKKYDTKYGLAVTLFHYGKMLIEKGDPAAREKLSEAAKLFRSIGNEKKAEECESLISS